MTGWLVALVLATSSEELEAEHAQLEERLEAERAQLDALASEQKGTLTILDGLERLAREAFERTARIERTALRARREAATARAALAEAELAVASQEGRLRPKLLTLYRLSQTDRLGTLLSAGDFATLVRRRRALDTLVATDLDALETLSVVAHSRRLGEHRLERLEASAARYLQALHLEQAVAGARQARFRDLLASVTAEQNRRGRLVAELEASERELGAMLKDLHATGAMAGMRARKGHLPFPTRGQVEVGFGKVVNPRFNTVTVQKGLDIRAKAGAEVVAVAPGTVVFAGWLKGYGNLVIVDHGSDYHSLYAHLERVEVDVGTAVEEEEVLGLVGDTGSLKGAYLYFEIRKAGQAIDPLPWLEAE